MRETLCKTLVEKEMARAKVQSLRESSKSLKRDLADCKDELSYAKIHVDIEAKWRVD